MAVRRLPTLAAVKHGLAELVTADLIDRLVHDDARFAQAWSQAASIPGSFGENSAAFFFALIRAATPVNIVEIGSYLGRSTAFLLLAGRAFQVDVRVTSIDPHTGDRQQMEKLGLEVLPSKALFDIHMSGLEPGQNMTSLVKSSHLAAIDWVQPIDLLYVDGWHSYDAVIEDGTDWLPFLTDHGVAVFDDYARYREVARAVDDLARDGRFYLWGSVFGLAVGGRQVVPPPGIANLVAMTNTWAARRLFRLRGLE